MGDTDNHLWSTRNLFNRDRFGGVEVNAHDVLHKAYMRADSVRGMLILLHAIRYVLGVR